MDDRLDSGITTSMFSNTFRNILFFPFDVNQLTSKLVLPLPGFPIKTVVAYEFKHVFVISYADKWSANPPSHVNSGMFSEGALFFLI
jgi:hypothetical protein